MVSAIYIIGVKPRPGLGNGTQKAQAGEILFLGSYLNFRIPEKGYGKEQGSQFFHSTLEVQETEQYFLPGHTQPEDIPGCHN